MLSTLRRRRIPLPDRGVELAVLDWGGDGPLALLHHATGFCAALWEPVALGLRERFHVVALDARGHGDSSKPEGGDAYHWNHFAHDLVALAEILIAEAGPVAIGIGHSFGGTATLLAAVERPQLFERIVLVDPVIFPSGAFQSDPERRARAGSLAEGARRRRDVFADREAARARWRKRPMFASWDPRVLDLYVAEGLAERPDGSVVLKCPSEVEAFIFERGASVDPMEQAQHLRVPALVLWARNGDFPRAHFEELVRRMPDGRLHDAPTGHLVPMEDPGLVVREVLAFSARPDSRDAASPKSPPPARPRS
jgi:pimeloyl-ACP methyl ester carboxylesterase